MKMSFVRVLSTCRQKMQPSVLGVSSSVFFSSQSRTPSFGLLIDLDGVIVLGNTVIPKVIDAIKRFWSSKGEIIVPSVFVTNSGNQLAEEKAKQLSELLGMEIPKEHMLLAHSPFKAFHSLHDKNVLVTGQGRVKEIAKSVGFRKILTLDDLLKTFPMLDAVDMSRRVSLPIPEDVEFSPVEAILLLGEPVRWETFLQLLMDIIVTDGDPRRVPPQYPYPHMPVLVCNMDLLWRFTPQIPRFGHGVFLLCLESVYKKVTGKDLQYKVMVGKPALVTYRYAEKLIMEQARNLGIDHEIKTIYMIGDNINTDIFGGNLYRDYIVSGKKLKNDDFNIETTHSPRNCTTVLVKTGVSSEELNDRELNHVHRDFVCCDRRYRQPTHTVNDFSDAIDLIFQLEKFG